MRDIKKQKQTPEKIRGIKVTDLSQEKINHDKSVKQALDIKMQRISIAIIASYLLFFCFLFKILQPLQNILHELGVGLQAVIATLGLMGIHHLIYKYQEQISLFKNKGITDMLQVFALICVIVALVSINDIPQNLLELVR